MRVGLGSDIPCSQAPAIPCSNQLLPLGYGPLGHPTAVEGLPCPSTSHHDEARGESGIAEKIPPGKGGNEKFKCMYPAHGQQFWEGTPFLPCHLALVRDAALCGRWDVESRQEEPPSFPPCRTPPRPRTCYLKHSATLTTPPHGAAGPGPPPSLARLCLQDHRHEGLSTAAAAGKRHHAAKIHGNCPLLETARHGQEDGETTSHLPLVFFFF